MSQYEIGATVRVTGTFEDSTGTVRDPTAVYVTICDPDGLKTTYDYAVSGITKSSTGVYYADVDANKPGRWYYRWYSTGSYKAASESSFTVVDAVAR